MRKPKRKRIGPRRKYMQAWHKEHPDYSRQTLKAWRKKHPEAGRKSTAKYHSEHREKIKSIQMKCLYGITLEEYNEMLQAQHYVCKICSMPPKGKRPVLVIDHDHATGKVRGLLCTRCNTMVGWLEHALQEKAEKYLKENS